MLGCLQSCAAAVCIHISQYSPTALHGASKKFAIKLAAGASGNWTLATKCQSDSAKESTVDNTSPWDFLFIEAWPQSIHNSSKSSFISMLWKQTWLHEWDWISEHLVSIFTGRKQITSEREGTAKKMTLERQRKTSQYVKRILSPPSKEPQVFSSWVNSPFYRNVSLVWRYSSHDIFLFRSLIWKWHWLVRGVVGSLHWPPESLQGDLIKWQIQIHDTVQAIHNGVLSSVGGNLHQGPQCVWAGGIQYPLSTLITGPWNSLSSSLGMVTSISFDIIVLLINIDYHT